ncbi:hypothetical protein EPUS_02479 [Endocarpon pusillum Z07020]|uniref:C2H2-type domain-containing protein n=1 Tax=Endocarpon pusillum (strain Z07020 / HMAS-L-300199) TaxID=1263415 RepID=U1GET3_ENDPU|nr:uncharacterized protein EPUS_02479 [Endocarpon pusillum Z07020]ERF70613.1 hypothetical protein EPUS_02479 [Endocarpon pusillum Z07020]
MDLGGDIQNDTASEDVLMSDAIPQINDEFDPSEAYITPKWFTEHSSGWSLSHSKTSRERLRGRSAVDGNVISPKSDYSCRSDMTSSPNRDLTFDVHNSPATTSYNPSATTSLPILDSVFNVDNSSATRSLPIFDSVLNVDNSSTSRSLPIFDSVLNVDNSSTTRSLPILDSVLDVDNSFAFSAVPSGTRVQKSPATFQCTLCPKRYTRAFHLRTHLAKKHTDKRPFVCTVCGKGFARYNDVKRHERHERLHSEKKKFVCKGTLKEEGWSWGCGRRFARAEVLGRHFRTEAGRNCIKPLLEKETEEGRLPEAPPSGYLPAALLAQYPALAVSDSSSAGIYDNNLGSGHDSPVSFDPMYSEGHTPGERTGNPINTCTNNNAQDENKKYPEPDIQVPAELPLLNAYMVVIDTFAQKILPPHFLTTPSTRYTADWSSPSVPYPPESAIADRTVNPQSEKVVMSPASHIIEKTTPLQQGRLFGQLEQKIENTKAGSKKSASDTNSLHGDSRLVDNKVAFNKLVPSDSGYHTGLGTDTESVCSLGSVGTSLGLPQDFLQEFIAFFGDTLIDKAGARAWAGYALAQHAPEVVEHRLDGMLKDYAADLLSISQEVKMEHKQPHQTVATDRRIASGATKLIRRYRPKIARYFRDHAVSTPSNSKSMAERLQGLGKQLSLTEKLGLFEKVASSGRTDADNALDDECDDGDEGEYMADIAPIRDFLVSGKAFQDLATAMRRSLYCDDRTSIDRIAHQILERLSEAESAPCPRCSGPQDDSKGCSDHRPIYSVRFQVSWDPQGFLQSQFGNRAPRIGSLVALTGSALYAQATTCSEYLQTNWPRSGSFVLSTLQKIIDPGKGMGSKEHRDYTGSLDGLDLRMAFRSLAAGNEASKRNLFVDARGAAEMLVELAQQLAWIGAVLRPSPYDEKLAYCKAAIQSSGSIIPCFAITFQCERLHPTENPCWLPLFCGASIARDFPIPDRQEEMGLEIPLEIMMGIAGVRHVVEYEGGVVMKGFSIMFVPMRRSGNRVQWHLISSPNCDTRLSYRDVLDRCQDRASLNEVDLGSLRTTRAIVGWCSAASSLLGSDTANYGNIDYSGANDADTPLKLAGGVLGFQHLGVAQFDFTLGPKDGKCHFQRSGPYQRIISAAEKTPVVLYDTAEKRAWLVPASGVMLHMAHHRNRLELFETNGKRVKLLATGPAGPSAKEILLKCASMDLSNCGEYTFKDMVINIWSQLEFLIDQNVRRDRTPGTAVTGKLRDVIHGFEFKAVVEERSPFRRKQKTIGKTNGGWPALVRDIDALVLFANGYEDIIRPQTNNNNQSLCSLWRTVPKWKDYLAASVKTLKDLYDVAGCRLDQTYLTSTHLQWHRGNSSLFEPCQTPEAYRCQCIRLQQIVPKSAIGRVVPPGLLVDDAAVIFGQSTSPLRDLIAAPQKPKPNGIYGQQNVRLLTPPTLYQDHDDVPSSVNSESEPSARSGSDVTSSTPTSYTSFISQGSIAANMNDLKSDPEHTHQARKNDQKLLVSLELEIVRIILWKIPGAVNNTILLSATRTHFLNSVTPLIRMVPPRKNQKQNHVPIGGNSGGRDEASCYGPKKSVYMDSVPWPADNRESR